MTEGKARKGEKNATTDKPSQGLIAEKRQGRVRVSDLIYVCHRGSRLSDNTPVLRTGKACFLKV